MTNKQLKICYIIGVILILAMVIASIICFYPMSSPEFILFVVVPILFYDMMGVIYTDL